MSINIGKNPVIYEKQTPKDAIRWIFAKFGIVIILIGMCVVLSIINPHFLAVNNLINIIRQISVTGIVAMGVTFTIITAGIDVGSGSVIGFVGVMTALLASLGQPLPIVLLVGVAVGGITGIVNGTLVVKGMIHPFIATLGMQMVARGAAMITSQGRPIVVESESFLYLGQGMVGFVPVPVILFILVGAISHFILRKTTFGRHVYAVGGNEQAAITCGINRNRVLVMVYMYAGLLTGIAGCMLTARVGAGAPSAGLSYEFDAITASVVGGTSFFGGVGRITTVMLGALVIGVLNNGMDLLGIDAYWQQVVRGSVIVLAVVLDAHRNKAFNS